MPPGYKNRLWALLCWCLVGWVLWQTFRWYTAPGFVRDLADLLWSCL